MEVNNGENTSFWHDSWSRMGCLKVCLRERGTMDLRILDNALVSDVLARHRRRRHIVHFLNDVENEIEAIKTRRSQEEDITLWKQVEDKYAKQFSTKKTWLHMRQSQLEYYWSKGVWFPHSTPKYSFLVWVAMKNRLQTCDRMHQWNNTIDVTCVLCKEAQETCQHLFFGCQYSGEIWKEMVGGILKGDFTTDWGELISIISNPRCSSTEVFPLRYIF